MKNSSISDYILALASSAPAPGGGSSAALSGAMAAALVSMVANLTIGREKYAAFEILARDSQARAEILSRELCDCIQKDMDAYNGVVTALRLPKSTDEEKAKRLEELQASYKKATAAPVEVAEKCLEVMELALALLHKSNISAVCDLSAAAVEARAGILIALENVNINLSFIKDSSFVSEKRSWAEKINSDSEALLNKIKLGD